MKWWSHTQIILVTHSHTNTHSQIDKNSLRYRHSAKYTYQKEKPRKHHRLFTYTTKSVFMKRKRSTRFVRTNGVELPFGVILHMRNNTKYFNCNVIVNAWPANCGVACPCLTLYLCTADLLAWFISQVGWYGVTVWESVSDSYGFLLCLNLSMCLL